MPGQEEEGQRAENARPAAVVRRGALMLPGRAETRLFDIAGQSVMDLRPGQKDVSSLVSGVYFVTTHPSPLPQAEKEKRSAAHKVAVQGQDSTGLSPSDNRAGRCRQQNPGLEGGGVRGILSPMAESASNRRSM
jgi:hypothetical protein